MRVGVRARNASVSGLLVGPSKFLGLCAHVSDVFWNFVDVFPFPLSKKAKRKQC